MSRTGSSSTRSAGGFRNEAASRKIDDLNFLNFWEFSPKVCKKFLALDEEKRKDIIERRMRERCVPSRATTLPQHPVSIS